MTPEQFQKLFAQKLNDIKRYALSDLPRHIGKIAVDHYHENFMKGGYVDEALSPWKPSKRIGTATGASGAYGTLLSSRKELYNSIRFTAQTGKTVVSSSLRYSRIHNEGGVINQQITITPKMRRFAWAKYYEENPTSEPGKAGQWKALALTKKTMISRSINMPKRQYMGKGSQLRQLILTRATKDIERILFTN